MRFSSCCLRDGKSRDLPDSVPVLKLARIRDFWVEYHHLTAFFLQMSGANAPLRFRPWGGGGGHRVPERPHLAIRTTGIWKSGNRRDRQGATTHVARPAVVRDSEPSAHAPHARTRGAGGRRGAGPQRDR